MISIIIPTLNDAVCLDSCLCDLDHKRESTEVLVVDGGSIDGTLQVLERYPWVKVITSPPGRGCQMNAGAAEAQGEILLFLHADTRLPLEWQSSVLHVIRQPRVVMGAFKLKLDQTGWPYRLIEWAVDIRSRFLGLPYGDQAFFILNDTFKRLGCFKKLPLMEDVALVQESKSLGRVASADQWVVSSARNWQRDGLLSRTWRNLQTYMRFRLGQPIDKVERYYRGERRALIVFCKEPVAGKVKTRLAADIGNEEAATVYRRLVEKTLEQLASGPVPYRVIICFDPPGSKSTIQGWLGIAPGYIPQVEGDLGDRMLAAFHMAEQMGFDKTVLVGTDCPPLEQKHVLQAFRLLDNRKVVLGPTQDGGYYLVAARHPHPEIFNGIPWSTEGVLKHTLKAGKAAGLSMGMTETLRDLDNLEDLDFHGLNGGFNDA